MASSAVIGWRILFVLLFCTMVANFAYAISINGSPFRRELFSRLMVATVLDIYINIVAIAAWIFYKEANWIAATIWIVFLVCFGSVATCTYVLWQLWQLSSQESFEDIMYHVLIKKPNKNGMEQHREDSNVMIAKITFTALSCVMAVNIVYVFSGGSIFRKELFTPWMVATLVNFYIDAIILSIWMFYKEESWLTAIFWIVLLQVLGSFSTCPFIVKELFKLHSDDPAHLILFKGSHSDIAQIHATYASKMVKEFEESGIYERSYWKGKNSVVFLKVALFFYFMGTLFKSELRYERASYSEAA